MTINLPPDLEAAVAGEAQRLGTTPESVVASALRQLLQASPSQQMPSRDPQEEWERRLAAIGRPYGVSLSNEALSRESLYD